MFYCDPCADARDWPGTMFRSKGKCEVCGQVADCNDKPSKDLPLPCPLCKHAEHGDGECDKQVGYDHLSGDHECGCPGVMGLFRDDTSIRTSSIALHLQECETARMEKIAPDGDGALYRVLCDDGYWVGWNRAWVDP